ncbi:MAG: hypothetical protein ACI84K_000457 [Pseudohongiellaceae bacterium]|jgi:hypothetical protein
MLPQKMRALLFLLYIGLGLTACDSFTTESESKIFDDANKDVVSPSIVISIPDGEATGVEIDSFVRITFSELMNTEVLDKESEVVTNTDMLGEESEVVTGENNDISYISAGLLLYSGRATNERVFQLSDERPRRAEYSVKLGVADDKITNNKIDIDVTSLTLQHASGRFALNNEYTVFISGDVVDLADDPETKIINEGNKLGKDFKLSFKTEEGEWKNDTALAFRRIVVSGDEPELLEGGQFEPNLSSNAAGDVLAVWRQSQSGGTNEAMGIWAGRYLPAENKWVLSNESSSSGASTENVERIDDTSLVTDAFGPKVVINKEGKAVAAWYQASEGSAIQSIWVNELDDSNNWTAPKVISKNEAGGNALSPEIGIDDEGNILSVWLEGDNGVKLLKSAYSNTNTRADPNAYPNGWSAPVVLNNTFTGDARQPTLSVSADGVAMVAWSQKVSGIFDIYVSRFSGGSWNEPKKLNFAALPDELFSGASKPKIAIDKNSDAFVIWQQRSSRQGNDELENIWTSRFSGGVWSDSFEMEETNEGDAFDPFITFGSNNQAFAIWVQPNKDNSLKNAIVYRYYSLDTGWEKGQEMLSSEAEQISNPIIQFDFEGNAVAAWIDGGSLEKARYSKLSSSWAGLPANSPFANNVQSINIVSLLQDGRYINVWTEFKEGSFKLLSSLFKD